MRTGQLITALAVSLAFTAAMAAPPSYADPGVYFKVSDISRQTLGEVVEDLRRVKVVVVGEQHGDAAHHQAQLAVIKALREAGARPAVAMEMFRVEAQEGLDAWVRGDLPSEDLFDLYSDNWQDAYWWIYRDIFLYAREHSIPLVGINVPRSVIGQVARKGIGSLTEAEQELLPDISCQVSVSYLKVLRAVTGIKEQDDESFSHFCTAQVLWDTLMAQNILRFTAKNPDHVVVVMAGNFHAWKHGIPGRLNALSDLPVRVILPSSDSSFLRYDIFTKDADYVWWPAED